MKWERTTNIGNYHIRTLVEISDDPSVDIDIISQKVDTLADTFLLSVTIQSHENQRFYIENIAFSWDVKIIDMHGLYLGGDPRDELGYLPFWSLRKDVAAHTGLPYMALIHRNGENRAAFGLLDQITETSLNANLSEITRCYHLTMQKPASKDTNHQRIPVEGVWQEVFFISSATDTWPSVLGQYAQLSVKAEDQTAMLVPEHAYDPVFCTWTAIHHDVSHNWIMKNAPIAASLGFKTWLTDDGWFLDRGKFGIYEEVGDWFPNASKFPDFKAHVAAVKALGFRYVLWVAPFMIGGDSHQAQEYSHLLIDGSEENRFHNLSPWNTETKTIVTNLLQRLVKDYNLDGLKIDFIDSISIHSRKPTNANEQPIGENISAILQSVTDTLLKLKPDLLVEFRNNYTNLASCRYANVYRSADVPINFCLNRWQAVMLRLLTPDRAIHLDPMLWHPDDSDENVAVHLINGISSVPMISIELDKYPQNHINLIRYWIAFYNEHRETIIHGNFKPVLRPTSVPSINFVGLHEVITGLYENVQVTIFENVATQWILNASTDSKIYFSNKLSKPCQVVKRNKFGKVIFDEKVDGLQDSIDTEIGGSVQIKCR